MPSRATSLLLSLFPFGPARLRSFPGVLFALLCREFLSRGVSAPPSELDSRLILFRHVFFALTMRTAAHSLVVATERVTTYTHSAPRNCVHQSSRQTRAVVDGEETRVHAVLLVHFPRIVKCPNSQSEWAFRAPM